MTVRNILAYHGAGLYMTEKRFIAQATDVNVSYIILLLR
jgi:hypothetical protein